MEISRIITNLEDFNQVSSDNDLDLIIEDLSKFSYEDFIYIEDPIFRTLTIGGVEFVDYSILYVWYPVEG